ncbi:hypothetical protein ACFPC0_25865, partial [Streptomyces andamanensis]
MIRSAARLTSLAVGGAAEAEPESRACLFPAEADRGEDVGGFAASGVARRTGGGGDAGDAVEQVRGLDAGEGETEVSGQSPVRVTVDGGARERRREAVLEPVTQGPDVARGGDGVGGGEAGGGSEP